MQGILMQKERKDVTWHEPFDSTGLSQTKSGFYVDEEEEKEIIYKDKKTNDCGGHERQEHVDV